MNVASLELCRELYELSGWDSEAWFYPSGSLAVDAEIADTQDKISYAYDLSYLLRKLPKTACIMHTSRTDEWEAFFVSIRLRVKAQRFYADTPEDAAAKLAIELFKQGILKHEAAA